MVTNDHIITNGPSKWDIMLALFDNEGCQRLLSFTAESARHRALEAKRNVSGGYDGLTREEEIDVEVYDLNIGPYEMKVLVLSVKVDGSEKWKVSGIDMENHHDVTIQYSTKTRKGKCEIGRAYLDPKDDQDVDFAYHMPAAPLNWTCDWCKKSFSEDEAHPHQASADGGTICAECREKGYGRDTDEDDDNENPLEGAVEPVGGTPSKDRPIYDRHGMLIGHAPIEEPYSDGPDHEDYDL